MNMAKKAPTLGLGCAGLTDPGDAGARVAEAVVRRAWERGVRLFDTAPLYGGGLSEERLGAALAGLPRDEYVLCTKTGVTRPRADRPLAPGMRPSRAEDVWDYSAAATVASLHRSMRRLRTDRIDVVHLHDVENHLRECLQAYDALQQFKAEGRVGGIGIGSNLVEPPMLLMQDQAFDAVLIAGRYTLLDQSAGPLLQRFAARGARVIVGGIFNSGILAGSTAASALFDYKPAPELVIQKVRAIEQACSVVGVSIKAAAIHYVLRNDAVSTVLIGPRTVAELDELLDIAISPPPDELWSGLERALLA
jgi:D-threo-aldose 1-dehydrogenase